MKRWILWIGLLLLTGCASTLPEKTVVAPDYSLRQVQMVEVRTQCDDAETSGIRTGFVKEYCESLHTGFKQALKNSFSNFQMVEAGGDLVADLTLEQLHGGSDAWRFWIGFGAGRTVTTTYLKMVKDGQIIAEKRFIETTTLPDIFTGSTTNEEGLMRDIPLLNRKMVAFVKQPE